MSNKYISEIRGLGYRSIGSARIEPPVGVRHRQQVS